MPQPDDSLAARLAAAKDGFDRLVAAHPEPPSEAAAAGFRHWGDTPQWYDWQKR